MSEIVVNPGPSYRLLKKGETIEDGDEFFVKWESWKQLYIKDTDGNKMCVHRGKRWSAVLVPVRRRVLLANMPKENL